MAAIAGIVDSGVVLMLGSALLFVEIPPYSYIMRDLQRLRPFNMR